MKRIILGVLSIFALVAVVTGSAFALFSDTATVSGVTLSSGNADLKIETDFPNLHDGVDDLNLAGFTVPALYPGVSYSHDLWLQNKSASNFALHVTGQLTAANNWPNLADYVQVRISAKSGYGTGDTGWHTLSEWNAAPIAFPTDIPHSMPNDHWGYVIELKVDPSVGNDLANKTLSNIVFTLTGTQVN